jgi:serine protease Do
MRTLSAPRNRGFSAGAALAGALVVFVLLLITPHNAALASTPPGTVMVPADFSGIAEKASSAVVNIRTTKTNKPGKMLRQFSPFGEQDPFNDFFDRFFGDQLPHEFRERSLGSGFIMGADGLIVTNNHVVEKADTIQVKLNNGKEFDAEVIGKDPKTDLALIKIKSAEKLPFLPLGNSDGLRVGEWVVAIGSPFGLEHTVTAGIVSAKGRVIGTGPYDDFIQTDASINPGNSGGPLLNLEGQVVGINTAIVAQGQGIGFAIPINMARGILGQLQKSGEVTRGWLGVAIQDVTEELADYYKLPDTKGAMISKVFPDDPADKAGLRQMDVVREVNGKAIESGRDLSRYIAEVPVGEKAKVTVFREGKTRSFDVEIAKRDEEEIAWEEGGGGEGESASVLGLKVTDITPEIARKLELDSPEGVLVEGVDPESKAAMAGIVRGDVIKELNREPVTSVEDFKKKAAKVKGGGEVSFFISGQSGFKVVKITK